jgi:hypothetical protein
MWFIDRSINCRTSLTVSLLRRAWLVPCPSRRRDVLRAGLSSAKWITVDDTGAHHKTVSGLCAQIGSAHFAWFGTTGSKNRGNFLDLCARHDDYVINAEALAYMHQRALAGPVIARIPTRSLPVRPPGLRTSTGLAS